MGICKRCPSGKTGGRNTLFLVAGLEDGHVDEAGGRPVVAALICGVGTAPLLCGPTMLGIWLHRSGGFQKRNGYIGAFQERSLRSGPHVGNLFYLSFVAQIVTRSTLRLSPHGLNRTGVCSATLCSIRSLPFLLAISSRATRRSGRGLARYSEGRAYLLLPVSSGSASIALARPVGGAEREGTCI